MTRAPTPAPGADGAGRRPTTRRVVVVSFLVDLLDVGSNLVVAVLTGSAVVFAEMAQGAADAVGSLLLVVGERRARRPRDAQHPFGYAREIFFWALLSSMVMLLVGAGVAVARGLARLRAPVQLDLPGLALGVVALSLLTNGYALAQGVRALRGDGPTLLSAFRRSRRQLVKTAFLQDLMGTTSAALGLVALAIGVLGGVPALDAVGGVLIGVVTGTFALLLVAQARSLIAGEAVPPDLHARLVRAVAALPEVERVNRLTAIVAGSEEILVDADLDLREDLTTSGVERVLDEVARALRTVAPHTGIVRVDLNSARAGRR